MIHIFLFFQLETVSLAFDFLKDETGSIMSDNDGNVESLETEEQDKPPVFRFRPPPPPTTGVAKYIFSFVILSFCIRSDIGNSLLVIIIMNYHIVIINHIHHRKTI